MARKRGWEREPARHSLAARGHKTASVKTMKGMFNASDGSNVAVSCKHCSSKLYPSAGKYTEDEIRKAGLVKVRFIAPEGSGAGSESMWVRVERVEDGKVHGRLDNDPIAVDMKFNDPVEVPTDAVVQVWDPEYEKRFKKAAEAAEREKML